MKLRLIRQPLAAQCHMLRGHRRMLRLARPQHHQSSHQPLAVERLRARTRHRHVLAATSVALLPLQPLAVRRKKRKRRKRNKKKRKKRKKQRKKRKTRRGPANDPEAGASDSRLQMQQCAGCGRLHCGQDHRRRCIWWPGGPGPGPGPKGDLLRKLSLWRALKQGRSSGSAWMRRA